MPTENHPITAEGLQNAVGYMKELAEMEMPEWMREENFFLAKDFMLLATEQGNRPVNTVGFD